MFFCASENFGSNSLPTGKLLGKPSKPTRIGRCGLSAHAPCRANLLSIRQSRGRQETPIVVAECNNSCGYRLYTCPHTPRYLLLYVPNSYQLQTGCLITDFRLVLIDENIRLLPNSRPADKASSCGSSIVRCASGHNYLNTACTKCGVQDAVLIPLDVS